MAKRGARSPAKVRYWRGMIGKWKASGRTHREFCEKHGVSVHTFRSWLYKLGLQRRRSGDRQTRSGRREQDVSPSPASVSSGAECSLPAFVPVRVAGQSRKQRAGIDIVLDSGRRIEIGPGFDPETLRDVIAVLEGI